MLPSGTKKRTGGKQQDPERIYREASAARKVKQYLDIHWEKIIKDEDRLQAVSKNLEPPPGNSNADINMFLSIPNPDFSPLDLCQEIWLELNLSTPNQFLHVNPMEWPCYAKFIPKLLSRYKFKILAPNSATLSRKSNGDTLSVHSSPGQTLKHSKGKSSHQRTGSEPVIMGTPRLATVTVTKGNSRKVIPVSELPTLGTFSK